MKHSHAVMLMRDAFQKGILDPNSFTYNALKFYCDYYNTPVSATPGKESMISAILDDVRVNPEPLITNALED